MVPVSTTTVDFPADLDLAELDVLDRGELDAVVAEFDEAWPPAGMVDATVAGPQLAALLNTVCLPGLDADRLVEVAAGAARLVSWAAAREIAATAALTVAVASFRGVGAGVNEIVPEQMAAA